MSKRQLELLSPAANASIARQAILHGADAVYIGPPSHGARKSAANSLDDIAEVVDFAHQYRAKVYATVNTIVYDSEVKKVETLCRDLYTIGVDALIIQDLGILRMNLPPIALHASTQCDIRTPEKAKFLEEVGFSQLVLARELSIEEIKKITSTVNIPVETFVHGALCVSYSGRCHASHALTGRSANRGECAQICRYPFTLKDSYGKEICRDKYLLSLKDFNASKSLQELVDAGVSSFKIEGRLKDMAYVKNITALYHLQLNNIVRDSEGKFERSSYGEVELKFIPKEDKSFNRGFTDYFLRERRPFSIASLLTPKSQGELIANPADLNNGDGISFFNKEGSFTGVNINRVDGEKIYPARKIEIPEGAKIYRTSDVKWDKLMGGETAERKIKINIEIDDTGVTARDERGLSVRMRLPDFYEEARNPMDYKNVFNKFGNTIYTLNNFKSYLDPTRFYRLSELSNLRRILVGALDQNNKATYPFSYRKGENPDIRFPYTDLDYRDNVSNKYSERFYRDHGVKKIEKALETSDIKKGDVVMTTRHCILRELGICRKEGKTAKNLNFPLYLHYAGGKLELGFNCSSCEMEVKLPRKQ